MIIETKDLVKEYSGRRVVNRVSITVEQGSVVGLLGPNGAGKTTTFYMIVGIERPDEGVVTLDGDDIVYIDGEDIKAKSGNFIDTGDGYDKIYIEDSDGVDFDVC